MEADGQYKQEGFYGAVQTTKEILYSKVNMHINVQRVRHYIQRHFEGQCVLQT